MKRVPSILGRLLKRAAGYTLTELMIATAIAAVIGGIMFIAIQAGLTLFAKNLAINQVHGAARRAVDQMSFDVARSVDEPRMVNVTPVPSTGDITHLDLALSDARHFVGRFNAGTGKVLDGNGAVTVGDYFVVTVPGTYPATPPMASSPGPRPR